jgi:hypothetical protein
MLVATARVRHRVVEIEGRGLPEGVMVTTLVPEGDETFSVAP